VAGERGPPEHRIHHGQHRVEPYRALERRIGGERWDGAWTDVGTPERWAALQPRR
jgi:NDP-sugar pyrophosphorylase family protein